MSKNQNKDQPLSLSVELKGTKISAKTNSRLVNALDGLLGSGVDFFKKKIDRMNKIDEIKTEILIDHIKTDPEIKGFIKASFERNLQKQINREVVAAECLAILSETATEKESDRDDQIDVDWLNYFGDYAEKATSDRLRKMWSLILAGEVRRPGSFSLATLRFIAELDQQIAGLFEKHTRLRYNFNPISILRPDDLSGETLLELSLLEEAGLLKSVVSSTANNIAKGEWRYCSDKSVGKLILVGDLNSEISLPTIMMTRVAIEILELSKPVDEIESLKTLAKKIEPFADRLELGIISKIVDDTIHYNILNKMK